MKYAVNEIIIANSFYGSIHDKGISYIWVQGLQAIPKICWNCSGNWLERIEEFL